MLEPDLTAPHALYRRLRYYTTAIVVILAHLLLTSSAPVAHVTPGPTPDLGQLVLTANASPQASINPAHHADTWYATTIQATALTWGEALVRAIVGPDDLAPLDTSPNANSSAQADMEEAVGRAADAARTALGPLAKHNPKMDARMPGVGGASAGLMTALSFVSASVNTDLAAGRRLAGTGTITSDGVVGNVAGVRYKVQAADSLDADVFFVPTYSALEATAARDRLHSDMAIVPVATLTDALVWLALD